MPRNTKFKIPNLDSRYYIDKIFLENFKSHKSKNFINLAPKVNLIFGKNSSGKSSIFQSLRLFRQSYGLGNMSPINLEPSEEYRTKGGISLDVGYEGIINAGNTKNSLGLGIGVGRFNAIKDEINSESLLRYKYVHKEKFYKGQSLINDKTFPSKITFKNGPDEMAIDLSNAVLYPQNSKIKFQTTQNVGGIDQIGSHPYDETYTPFYFNTKINKKNCKLGSILETYKVFEKIKDKKKLIELLKKAIQVSEEKFDKKKVNTKKTLGAGSSSLRIGREDPRSLFVKYFKTYSQMRNSRSRPGSFSLDIGGEGKDKRVREINERIEIFLKHPNILKLLIQEMSRSFFRPGDTNEKQSKRATKEISSLIKALSRKSVTNNANSFYNFFSNNIFLQLKNIKFYKGEFVKAGKEEGFPRFPFDNIEDEFTYLINILNWIFFKTNPSPFNKDGKLQPLLIYNSQEYNHTTIDDINRCMKKMIIIPGLRSLPKRYFVRGMSANYIGRQSENLAEILSNEKIKKDTNRWLKRLEIPYSVGTKKSGNYVEIVFTKPNSKFKISQNHIGLGYPLILPFIVQCLIGTNQIIVVEEPEIHLHPKIEADLAELVVWSSNNRRNQFLIETHSEEFLLRLLKNVRQKKVKPKHISINYVNIKKNQSEINKILVQPDGSYTTPWKDDLFSERTKEFI